MIPPRIQLRDVTWEAARRLLQSWIDGIQAVVNGGATISETMAGQVVTLLWNDDAAPVTVKTVLRARPLGVVLLTAAEPGSGSETLSGGQVVWRWVGSSLVVSQIDGLSPSTDYNVMVWVIGAAATPRSS